MLAILSAIVGYTFSAIALRAALVVVVLLILFFGRKGRTRPPMLGAPDLRDRPPRVKRKHKN